MGEIDVKDVVMVGLMLFLELLTLARYGEDGALRRRAEMVFLLIVSVLIMFMGME